MAAVSFTIPGKPTGKGRPRVTSIGGHARAFTPAETRSREGIVASLCMDAMRGRAAFAGPVEVWVSVVTPIPASWSKRKRAEAIGAPCQAKPDLDNVVKLLLDGVNGIAFVDDRQVTMISASKVYGEEPRTTMQIIEVTR